MQTTKLQTRCPHCKTLFEIQEAQLRVANGRVHCSCCDNIFDATEHLTQTDPKENQPQQKQQPQDSSGALSLNSLFGETASEKSAFPDLNTSTVWDDDNTPLPVYEEQPEHRAKDGLIQSDKERLDGESIDLQDDPLFTDLSENRESKPPASEAESIEPVAVAVSQNKQPADSEEKFGLSSISESIILSDLANKQEQKGHPILWSLAILFMLIAALAQIAWFARDELKPYPQVRELMELVCTQAGCKLPPWHEPERFTISSRSVRTHPKNNSALQIQIVFSNSARFAQSYPKLQLKLYDTKESLSAQRVFHPDEYLAEPHKSTSVIEPAQSVEVEMALADPGAGVTGFKIEFL